ncbi:protein takeout-like [Periplaneta americana]|uniref:protein takeout-like n=1 Tax=Periplaneta americana TaxID=6978 RepID=UPI0037E8FD74
MAGTVAAISLCVLLCGFQPSEGREEDPQPIKLLQEAPQWLKPCRLKDPNLNSCLKDTFQHMFPALASGIPEINVERFEPLYLPKLGLAKGHGPVTISGSFYNILAHGPSNATATFASIDMKNGVFGLGAYLPDIRIEADYDLQGKVLILPLVGNGPARVHLKNVTTSMSSKFELPRLQGRQIIHIIDMKVDFDIQGMTVHFENLFNGNRILGRTMNTFMNKHALEIVNELKQPLEESFSSVFREIMNDALKHMPIDIWLLGD